MSTLGKPGPHRPLRVACVLLAVILGLGLAGCSSDRQESADPEAGEAVKESFTFFNLGANSQFSDQVREALSEELGNDAIGHRNMIDLEMHYPGFLKAHFPDLEALNRELNSEVGERVDHDTIKLMYRYARKRGTPFDYVEILFSGYDRHPLLFRIRFNEDKAGTVDTLTAKYGRPTEIKWDREGGKTLFWRKQEDYLMLSLVPDQFGVPDYHITIYFTANLKQLIKAERASRQKRAIEKEQSGRSAF